MVRRVFAVVGIDVGIHQASTGVEWLIIDAPDCGRTTNTTGYNQGAFHDISEKCFECEFLQSETSELPMIICEVTEHDKVYRSSIRLPNHPGSWCVLSEFVLFKTARPTCYRTQPFRVTWTINVIHSV
jgi:hypothetical protein